MAAEQSVFYKQLPDDVPQQEWKSWVRKNDAHLKYGVRRRRVSDRIASGTLPCFACPDESVRIPTQALEEAFGKADEKEPPRERARTPRNVVSDADLELDDPVVGMFRECRIMLKEEREHSRQQLAARDATNLEQLKLLTTPVSKSVELLQATAERLAARVEFLEQREDSMMREREEMAEFRHVRDLEIQRQSAADSRRAQAIEVLRKEWPTIVNAWASGSLRGFVSQTKPELVDVLIKSGMLTAQQQAQLMAVLEAMAKDAAKQVAADERAEQAAARAAQSNGASTGAPHSEEKAS